MNKTVTTIIFAISVITIAVGLIFLCAATQAPTRLFLAAALLLIGAALAAWSGMGLRKMRQLAPENLSDQITSLAEQSGHAEVTLSQVIAGLSVPDEDAQRALDLLVDKGQCTREFRGDTWFYLFPGLKESKVIRRCSHCGREYSVKTPLYECPNCGGKVELVRV